MTPAALILHRYKACGLLIVAAMISFGLCFVLGLGMQLAYESLYDCV